jgi:hypothetical protein
VCLVPCNFWKTNGNRSGKQEEGCVLCVDCMGTKPRLMFLLVETLSESGRPICFLRYVSRNKKHSFCRLFLSFCPRILSSSSTQSAVYSGISLLAVIHTAASSSAVAIHSRSRNRQTSVRRHHPQQIPSLPSNPVIQTSPYPNPARSPSTNPIYPPCAALCSAPLSDSRTVESSPTRWWST